MISVDQSSPYLDQGVLGEGEATFVALDPFVIKTLGHSHNAHTSRCI